MNPVRLGKAWTPTEADVAAYIRARTKIPGGEEAGTFTEETRPNAEQVRRLIGQAVRFVSTKIGGDPCSDDLRESARDCAAMKAAMMAEQSYWPEQTGSAGSSFQSLGSMFKEEINVLATAVAEQCGQGEGGEGSGGGPHALPVASFDHEPIIGRGFPEVW
jgi:hypothetical protein